MAMTTADDETPHASPLPNYLVERYKAWRATRFASDRAWYQNLAESGQRPRAMIVACCDSRVDVHGILGAEPGDLFMVRNVANLCPPYQPDHEHHGTSAAIEYAVTGLKVAHIVVLGHAQCGGVGAYLERRDSGIEGREESRFIDRWMDILAPGYERLPPCSCAGDDAAATEEKKERQRALEQESVVCSLRNLESFPFVREAVATGRLTLHGAWFDITEGELYGFDAASGRFKPFG